jgi:hypothetical protein
MGDGHVSPRPRLDFLIDADEALTPELLAEVRLAIQNPNFDGYHVALRMYFLGRVLRRSGASFYKLSLFRRGKGRFECRLKDQDTSMADMEVHEHVVVDGRTGSLKNPLLHHNVDSLSRYIQKHDEYSNWEARVWMQGDAGFGDLPPDLFGTQAQRRRWLKKRFSGLPGSPALLFLYRYVFRFGFLDGAPGLIYCGLPEHSVVSRQGQDLRVKDPRSEGEGQCAIRTSTTESS